MAVKPDVEIGLAETEQRGRDIAVCLEYQTHRLRLLGGVAVLVRVRQVPDQAADLVVADLVVPGEVEVVLGVGTVTGGSASSIAEPFNGSARVAA
jgi:hypothetical protein